MPDVQVVSLRIVVIICSGYVQALTNDLTSAVESFHKALGIRREDTFRY